MKKAIIVITIILMAINLLFGFLLTGFEPFNVGFTTIVILVNGILLYVLQSVTMKDAFAITLTFLFSFIGIILYVLGLLSPDSIEDNVFVIATIIFLVIEIVILFICSLTSKSIK